MIEDILLTGTEKMDKAVEATKEDFATVRTGRANPQLFQKIMVDYYGTPTPLAQLASLQNPEARTIIVTPYDKSALGAIEKAIRDIPNLGANPTNDGFYIKGLPQGDVTIYSISGQYIKHQKFDAQTKINLSEMESGIYLVQVEGKGVAFISKMD